MVSSTLAKQLPFIMPWNQLPTLLTLEPFNDTHLAPRFEHNGGSNICYDAVRRTGVACGACRNGFEFDATDSFLRCRDEPVAKKLSDCTMCQIQDRNPRLTGPCEICIAPQIDPHSGRCSCK